MKGSFDSQVENQCSKAILVQKQLIEFATRSCDPVLCMGGVKATMAECSVMYTSSTELDSLSLNLVSLAWSFTDQDRSSQCLSPVIEHSHILNVVFASLQVCLLPPLNNSPPDCTLSSLRFMCVVVIWVQTRF